jgi:hypothetical protein
MFDFLEVVAMVGAVFCIYGSFVYIFNMWMTKKFHDHLTRCAQNMTTLDVNDKHLLGKHLQSWVAQKSMAVKSSDELANEFIKLCTSYKLGRVREIVSTYTPSVIDSKHPPDVIFYSQSPFRVRIVYGELVN